MDYGLHQQLPLSIRLSKHSHSIILPLPCIAMGTVVMRSGSFPPRRTFWMLDMKFRFGLIWWDCLHPDASCVLVAMANSKLSSLRFSSCLFWMLNGSLPSRIVLDSVLSCSPFRSHPFPSAAWCCHCHVPRWEGVLRDPPINSAQSRRKRLNKKAETATSGDWQLWLLFCHRLKIYIYLTSCNLLSESDGAVPTWE